MSLLASALAWIGIAYTLLAMLVAGRWSASAPALPAEPPGVTVLKPLHGLVPGLADKLAGFLRQDYPAPVEMICGVDDPADPAARVARALSGPVTLVADPRRHGTNGKVSNLVNMTAHARNALIVMSDDDIEVAPDYLARIAAAAAVPGVGCVSCLYSGRGETGLWSRIAAAGISWQFLPGAMIGIACRLADPCMGSTIALRREVLDAIGGFAAVADRLADDHAIGAAVRATGLSISVPQMLVTHGCAETSLAALCAHELRWNVTVRDLTPAGYAGSAVTFPLAWSLIAVACGAGPIVPIAALVARLLLALRIDALVGRRTAPLWTLPFRDLLGFGLFVAAFFKRTVDWRGSRLSLTTGGRMAAEVETLSR
jgi:ceramide glucosyltransferase